MLAMHVKHFISLLMYGCLLNILTCRSDCDDENFGINCTFSENTCGWRAGNNRQWISDGGDEPFRYMALQISVNKGKLSHSLDCFKTDWIGCLGLKYRFTNNSVIELSVRTREQTRTLWKTNSSRNGWDRATVEIANPGDSTLVEILAQRLIRENEDSVHIANVVYWRSACPKQPVEVTTNTQPDKGDSESSTVGVVVAVVAVLVVGIAAAVIVYVLYRRGRLGNCFSASQSNGGKCEGSGQNTRPSRPAIKTLTPAAYDNHGFTPVGESDTYYSFIKDVDGAADSSESYYSVIHDTGATNTTKDEGGDRKKTARPTMTIASPDGGQHPKIGLRDNAALSPNSLLSARGTNPPGSSIQTDYSLAGVVKEEVEAPVYNTLEAALEGMPSGEERGGAVYQLARDPGDSHGNPRIEMEGVYRDLEDPSKTISDVDVRKVRGNLQHLAPATNPGESVSAANAGSYNKLVLKAGGKPTGSSEAEYSHLNNSDSTYDAVHKKQGSLTTTTDNYSHIG